MTRLALIESPWRDNPGGPRYLAWCIRDSLDRGETPIASHALYTLALPETDEGRERGIAARTELAALLERVEGVVAFYVDLGWSDGMLAALRRGPLRSATRCLMPDDLAAFQRGEWPSPARITLNHEIGGPNATE